jgi:hypothetical protein
LAPYARDPKDALALASRAHEIAIHAIGPNLWGHVFAAAAQAKTESTPQ